ncbi:MAG: hydrogenase, partial [Terracidiphilus sp.]
MATSELKTKDPGIDPATGEFRVVRVGENFRSITEKISSIVLTPHTPLGWFALFSLAGGGATMLLVAVTWLFLRGVGIWAITQPVAWGFAIINFVWWIGIGHAGTLISAILLLFKQSWRN